jgi:putative ABC transport system permease protein
MKSADFSLERNTMPAAREAVIQLGPWQMALLALPIAALVIVSLILRMGIERRVLLASVRAMVQLLLVGLIIGWVFDRSRWYWVVGLLAAMTLIAAVTAVRQARVRLRGLIGLMTIVLGAMTALTLAFLTQAVIGVHQWDARYLVPLGGMLLGNAMTAATLAVERLTSDLKRQGGDVEVLLAMGASPAQATRQILRNAVRAALTPTINAMLIVGIVKLPGMMTGQMLGGSGPMQAALYQMLILVGILFCDAGASMLTILLLYRRFFTSAWQLDRAKLRHA